MNIKNLRKLLENFEDLIFFVTIQKLKKKKNGKIFRIFLKKKQFFPWANM